MGRLDPGFEILGSSRVGRATLWASPERTSDNRREVVPFKTSPRVEDVSDVPGSRRSNIQGITRKVVRDAGFEPATSCV
jgi:hypothetical protein